MYIVIHGTEDGLYIDQLTKEELEKRASSDWYPEGFQSTWPREKFGAGIWPTGTWILKAELVVPQVVEKVISYKIP